MAKLNLKKVKQSLFYKEKSLVGLTLGVNFITPVALGAIAPAHRVWCKKNRIAPNCTSAKNLKLCRTFTLLAVHSFPE